MLKVCSAEKAFLLIPNERLIWEGIKRYDRKERRIRRSAL